MKLTLQYSTWAKMSKSYQHQICQHFDIVMIIQTIFHMFQKLEDIDAVKTRVQQCVHALKCCLQHSAEMSTTATVHTHHNINTVSKSKHAKEYKYLHVCLC